jgi:hypothetical protein
MLASSDDAIAAPVAQHQVTLRRCRACCASQTRHRKGKRSQQAVGQHALGAAAAGHTAQFLGGLEDQVQRAAEVGLLRQPFSRGQQHRCVAVVAAGVHAPGVAAAPGSAFTFGLLDRQRIHVRAQAQPIRSRAAPQGADHPGGRPVADGPRSPRLPAAAATMAAKCAARPDPAPGAGAGRGAAR